MKLLYKLFKDIFSSESLKMFLQMLFSVHLGVFHSLVTWMLFMSSCHNLNINGSWLGAPKVEFVGFVLTFVVHVV